ncbi:MAG TPA: Gmad2 immunoglobulin-like domain-containing protein [Dehalococcoidia bacterium]|nr:Gmad2 immunoglobulin-like domain-containing protein [Dehalococcoidia bacterium]
MRLAVLAMAGALLLAACGGGGSSVPDDLKSVCTQGASAAAETIKVSSPESGAEVRSPLQVSGTVNVSQAQFFFAIVGSDGTHISDYPGHASATGTPVPFQESVPFGVEEKTQACLWVSQANETDPADAIRIPITLLPPLASGQ